MASIEFRNVSKAYGTVQAVREASFLVEDGAFFCLFGPPSSGKTTILRLILGLETPDSGEILIDGRPARGVAERNVAMVFQNLALFPHMTAKGNIRFPLEERRLPEPQIAARVAEVAEKLHITHILHKPPAQLSGGERQRVAIARALVRDPAAYLMDDPISALDARLREEARVELKRIQTALGRTLVYVTHDQEEAMSVADRMAVLDRGRIVQIGTPSELYDHPASPYAARLLGSPPMNLTTDPAFGPAPQTGIRPEDLTVTPAADGAATITAVEPLGGYTVLTLTQGAETFRALLRGQPAFQPGTRATLSATRIHPFTADGHRLTGA